MLLWRTLLPKSSTHSKVPGLILTALDVFHPHDSHLRDTVTISIVQMKDLTPEGVE